MTEPITLEQLKNARLDAKTLELFINGNESVTNNTPRLLPKVDLESLAKLKKQLMAQMHINATMFATKSDLLRSSLTAGQFAFVHNDSTAENNGLYQKVGAAWVYQAYNPLNQAKSYADTASSETLNQAKSYADTASSETLNQAKSYADTTLNQANNLSINAGKLYPFAQKNRGGTVYAEHINDLEKAILDIKIINADPDKYYYLRFFAHDPANEANSGTANGWGFVSILKSNYEAGIDEIVYLTPPTLPESKLRVVPNSGIINHVFNSTNGELITLALDSSYLPSKAIYTKLPSSAGYDHIIDPSCYFYQKTSTTQSATQETKTDAQEPTLLAQRYGILPINSDGVADFDNLIFTQNVDEQSYPASTTKVLTALAALDYVSLQTSVTIIQSDLVTGSGYNLRDGDVISVQDLIINMMLPSSNIAATALARVAGSAAGENFISIMNKKAASLGMTNSRFVNPTGLADSRQLTTARDLMRLGVAASKHPEFSKLWSLKTATLVVSGANARSIEVESSFINVKDKAWCIGGKSGSFAGWGYNLFCQVSLQNGYKGIAVILKTSSKEQRDADMIAMVEYAKSAYAYPSPIKIIKN